MSVNRTGRTIEVITELQRLTFKNATFEDVDGTLFIGRYGISDPGTTNSQEYQALAAFAVGKWNSARVIETEKETA